MPAARTAMNMGNFAMESMESGDVIAVVIPCYKVRRHVLQVIDAIDDQKKVSSFMTLIAKARSILEAHSDALLVTEFENKILEKKDKLQGGA